MPALIPAIDDLEVLLEGYAKRPDSPVWLPVSLFTIQGRSVAISVRPLPHGRVLVTDGGETLSYMRDVGLDVEKSSALARDIEVIARQRGFDFDGGAISRSVTAKEIPTAALHLAEVEIGVSALLYTEYAKPLPQIFAKRARRVLEAELAPPIAQLVRFDREYAGKYKDGDFFCVAESAKPVGVKVVTNPENMRDALIVAMMYKDEPIDLVALRKPDITLYGPRLVQFHSYYANRQFEGPEKLAKYLNARVAS